MGNHLQVVAALCYQMHHMQPYIIIHMQLNILDQMKVYASKWSNIQLYRTQSNNMKLYATL